MTCDKAAQIHAYYDDVMGADEKSRVEAHLLVCAECRELLGELRGVTQMLASVSLPDMPQRTLNRMYGSWWASKQAQERGIRKLAAWMTAAAAAVMVIVPLLGSSPQQPDNHAVVWEARGLIDPTVPRDNPDADLIQVAQWMSNDLSQGTNQ